MKGLMLPFAWDVLPNSAVVPLLSSSDTQQSLLYLEIAGDGSTAYLRMDDGTNTLSVVFEWDADTEYNICGRYNADTSAARVGYSSGSWTWGTEGSFDGALVVGTDIHIAYSGGYPFDYADIIGYDDDHGESFIEANY